MTSKSSVGENQQGSVAGRVFGLLEENINGSNYILPGQKKALMELINGLMPSEALGKTGKTSDIDINFLAFQRPSLTTEFLKALKIHGSSLIIQTQENNDGSIIQKPIVTEEELKELWDEARRDLKSRMLTENSTIQAKRAAAHFLRFVAAMQALVMANKREITPGKAEDIIRAIENTLQPQKSMMDADPLYPEATALLKTDGKRLIARFKNLFQRGSVEEIKQVFKGKNPLFSPKQ